MRSFIFARTPPDLTSHSKIGGTHELLADHVETVCWNMLVVGLMRSGEELNGAIRLTNVFLYDFIAVDEGAFLEVTIVIDVIV